MFTSAATRHAVIGLAMLVASAGLVALSRRPAAVPDPPTARSSRQIHGVADLPRPRILANLLVDNEPPTRAAACQMLEPRDQPDLVPALLRRLQDTDPLVRESAAASLARLLPAPADQLRGPDRGDLPAWLEHWEHWQSRVEGDTGPTLCEVFADTRYLLFPDTLAQRCLACHAGQRPEPLAANDACRACHAGIHEQWLASAHAQSLTHLRLPTAGPSCTQPATIDFGDLRGIGCTECHEIARSWGAGILPAARDVRILKVGLAVPPAYPCSTGVSPVFLQALEMTTTLTSAPADICPHEFTPIEPSAVCSRCHADVYRQWQQWRGRPHPRRVDWPPGHIAMNAQADARSCVDCHMPALYDPTAGRAVREHRWPARCDSAVLRQGLDARLLWPDPLTADNAGSESDGRTATLILTNLAGHAYPAGTARRALRIEAGLSSSPSLPVLAVLTDPIPGEPPSAKHEPPLNPGEQRRLPIRLPRGADSVSWRITYVRNILDSDSPTTEILAGERRQESWARPIPARPSPPK